LLFLFVLFVLANDFDPFSVSESGLYSAYTGAKSGMGETR